MLKLLSKTRLTFNMNVFYKFIHNKISLLQRLLRGWEVYNEKP